MTGFLGKLPTVGDFITRNLPSDVADAWMDLVDSAFTIATRGAGQDWYEAHQDRPPLRFSLAPNAITAGGWVGLLRPSLDSFGRSYPITVLAPLPEGLPCLSAPRLLKRWYDRADIALLSAMEGSLTVDRLVEVLSKIAPSPDAGVLEAAQWVAPLHGDDESVHGWIGPGLHEDGAGSLDWYEMLLSGTLPEYGTPTLWWHPPHGEAGNRVLLLRSRPSPWTFRGLLDGSWTLLAGERVPAPEDPKA